MPPASVSIAVAPIVVPVDPRELEALLGKEWLLANQIGAYASSTVIGCNTRRYHGLLVAATTPPVGRLLALSLLMEHLTVDGQTFELATNEFSGTFAPRGFEHLREFRSEVAPTFLYAAGGRWLTKRIMLAEASNAVVVRYTLRGGEGTLRIWPFAALRDYHHIRKVHQPHRMTFTTADHSLTIEDRASGTHPLHVTCTKAAFEPNPRWWYRFCYRVEIARGQDGFEDLYTPGSFVATLRDGESCDITASLDEIRSVDFDTTAARRTRRIEELAESVGPDADKTCRRLAAATDTFVATRAFPDGPPAPTILAGYHWFADWGRDALVALPGLLLATHRHDLARQVLTTFSRRLADGLIPNRFDDYGTTPHYNSIDASLWFAMAADHYMAATGDTAFWRSTLMPTIHRILTAYHDGTAFDIHADADSLLMGGSQRTQLTWMDAALGEQVITPRHGKPVEVNALWHSAHRMMARRCAGIDDGLVGHYNHRAVLIASAFIRAFWNTDQQCLYDCVTDGEPDASIRPNQIFAVSLQHSPLSAEQQASVLRVVTEQLLTPYGLRTLSPADKRYRRRYGGSWESRDRAYHQGTVWPWLIGAFIDAYINVEGVSDASLDKAAAFLAAFDDHLCQAGLGYISEIFDGDAPHAPRGCIAQAWSVGEVLRAKLKIAELRKRRDAGQ